MIRIFSMSLPLYPILTEDGGRILVVPVDFGDLGS